MWVNESATESAIRLEDRNDTSPAWDLNNLIAPAYAWAALRHARLGTPASDDKARFFVEAGDRLFNGGVRRAWIEGNQKQFNQNYRWTFKFVEWRKEIVELPLANTSAGRGDSARAPLRW
jgi:hypothetical protein